MTRPDSCAPWKRNTFPLIFGAIRFLSLAVLTALTMGHGSAPAATIPVPNGSFESPLTPYVTINIDYWQKGKKPDWYQETGGFLWTQLTGAFKNTPEGSFDHLDNCDGDQALWLFVVPEVSLFQDYDSVDWNDSAPTHAFDATYEVGKSYALTVAINGSGGGMSNGATMQISLYYRDAASNMVTVAATVVTNTPESFSNHTHFIDYQALTPIVKATNAWAGQHIGILLLSTVTTNLQGGYWDLDHVRLSSFEPSKLMAEAFTDGQFTFTLQGEPESSFEILASADVTAPLSNWSSLGTVSNITGTVTFTDMTANPSRRFYQARQWP